MLLAKLAPDLDFSREVLCSTMQCDVRGVHGCPQYTFKKCVQASRYWQESVGSPISRLWREHVNPLLSSAALLETFNLLLLKLWKSLGYLFCPLARSAWSSCSASCGSGGKRKRSRELIKA